MRAFLILLPVVVVLAGCGGAAVSTGGTLDTTPGAGVAPAAVVTERIVVTETVEAPPATTAAEAVVKMPKLPKGVKIDVSQAPQLQILAASKLKYVDIYGSDTTTFTIRARNVEDFSCVFELEATFYNGDELLASQTDDNGLEPVAGGKKATFDFFTAGSGRATRVEVDAISSEC